MLLGITGNYGAGKSAVCDILEQHYNLTVLKADRYAHTLYEPDGMLFDAIAHSFDAVANGKIDRKRLGRIVFEDPEMKKKLDDIMWPVMSEHFKSMKGYDALEAAVLFEAEWDKHADYKMMVYIPEEKYLETITARGRERFLAEKILKHQLPQKVKEELSDFVIDNSGSLSETRKQIDEAMIRMGVKHVIR